MSNIIEEIQKLQVNIWKSQWFFIALPHTEGVSSFTRIQAHMHLRVVNVKQYQLKNKLVQNWNQG